MTNQKVYLVYYEFWDRYVDMICSTKEKAEARCEELRESHPDLPADYAWIKERELDKSWKE